MIKFNEDVLLGWIAWRIRKNKNAIIVINGPTGSGKTYAGLTLAYRIANKIGSHFSVKDNVAFSFSDMLKNTRKEQNTKPGTPFLFEEVGAVGGGASSREWQSKANRFFFSFLQTTRHRNQILIFTCPYFSFLDAGARALCHMQLLTDRIDFKEKKCFLKPYIIQVNSRTGKLYFKYLRFGYNGERIKLMEYGCDYPPDEVVSDYEKMKSRFTDALNQSILDDEAREDLKKNKPLKPKPEFNLERYKKLHSEGYTNRQICKIEGYCAASLYNYLRKYNKK